MARDGAYATLIDESLDFNFAVSMSTTSESQQSPDPEKKPTLLAQYESLMSIIRPIGDDATRLKNIVGGTLYIVGGFGAAVGGLSLALWGVGLLVSALGAEFWLSLTNWTAVVLPQLLAALVERNTGRVLLKPGESPNSYIPKSITVVIFVYPLLLSWALVSVVVTFSFAKEEGGFVYWCRFVSAVGVVLFVLSAGAFRSLTFFAYGGHTLMRLYEVIDTVVTDGVLPLADRVRSLSPAENKLSTVIENRDETTS